jgi:hypothetical protein
MQLLFELAASNAKSRTVIKVIQLYLVHVSFLLNQVDLDSRHIGWVTSELPGGDNHIIKIELKGPENTLRVRQVKVLGWKDGESTKIAGQISASVAQQRNCEAETLRVFRLITSQVSVLTMYCSTK